MKSFKQFLNEEPVGRERSPKEQAEWDKINERDAKRAAAKAQRGPTGAAARPDLQFKPQGTTTNVPGSKVRGAAADPWKQFPKKPQQQLGMPKTGPSSPVPGRTLAPAGGTSSKPTLPAAGQTQRGGALATTPKGGATVKNPPIEAVKVSDVTKPKGKLPSGTKGGALTAKPSSMPTKNPPIEAVKVSDVTKPKGKLPSVTPPTPSARQAIQNTKTGTDLAKGTIDTLGKGGKFSKWGGRALAGAGAALDAADEYKAQTERGRRRGSSAAMGVTKAAGGLAGAEAGAAGGAALGATIGSVIPGAGTAIGGAVGGIAGGIGGYLGGSHLAGKASEVIAGATGKEKAAMATANRQRQAGGALKGIGGPTSFDNKKGTMTTGIGSQRKTVKLANTSVVTDPKTGKQEVGYRATKNGQEVYKRGPSAQSLAQTSTNPFERFGRKMFAGAYKQSDAANAAKKLATARQSDTARNKALGVKFGPGK